MCVNAFKAGLFTHTQDIQSASHLGNFPFKDQHICLPMWVSHIWDYSSHQIWFLNPKTFWLTSSNPYIKPDEPEWEDEWHWLIPASHLESCTAHGSDVAVMLLSGKTHCCAAVYLPHAMSTVHLGQAGRGMNSGSCKKWERYSILVTKYLCCGCWHKTAVDSVFIFLKQIQMNRFKWCLINLCFESPAYFYVSCEAVTLCDVPLCMKFTLSVTCSSM